jgi:alcohol dehydrogenase class IV
MSRATWNFYSPGRLILGCGAVRALGPAVKRLNVDSVLVVTDPALVAAGVLDKVRVPLSAAGMTCHVFDGGEPEPSFACADRALAAACACRPAAILGLGGGSNMDLAKITATVMTHGGSYRDYFGFDRVPGPILPLVCVPTTAGTGSEVSHAAVLTDHEQGIKVSTLSQHLRPVLAVVDPDLTLTCPPRATADSGIDALTHAIEAYTATRYCDLDVPPESTSPYEGKFPLADLLAEEAIRLIGRHLVNAVRQPDNREARSGMALAATLAGLAFSNAAVALVHAMEYPLGGTLHCSHGAGNGLLLPYVMRYLLPKRAAELAKIAELLGEKLSGVSADSDAQSAIAAVERLREQIGIPARIREIGGAEDQLPEFAAKAFAIKRLMVLTPRDVTEADILAIYRGAL